METTEFDIGRTVICDTCGADWTNRKESGGLIFESKGICPDCTPGLMKSVKQYEEEHYIRAICPEGKSFADFVREYRGPEGNKVRITHFSL